MSLNISLLGKNIEWKHRFAKVTDLKEVYDWIVLGTNIYQESNSVSLLNEEWKYTKERIAVTFLTRFLIFFLGV